MTPPPVQIRTNYLLAYDLLETAAWFSQLSAHADVHLDRIQRAVAHLRGQHVQSPPGQETPNTIHESPRRDMAWLLRNDPWAAAIAAHVRFCDQAALADEILRLRAENERMEADLVAMAGAILEEQEDEWQSRAATRERETPDAKNAEQFATDVWWEIYTVDSGIFSRTCETREEAEALIRHQRNPENFEILRATTSRSRVSDNG